MPDAVCPISAKAHVDKGCLRWPKGGVLQLEAAGFIAGDTVVLTLDFVTTNELTGTETVYVLDATWLWRVALAKRDSEGTPQSVLGASSGVSVVGDGSAGQAVVTLDLNTDEAKAIADSTTSSNLLLDIEAANADRGKMVTVQAVGHLRKDVARNLTETGTAGNEYYTTTPCPTPLRRSWARGCG